MTRTRQQSAELKRRIVEQVKEGRTSGQVADALGCSARYVARVARLAGEKGKNGRPKKT